MQLQNIVLEGLIKHSERVKRFRQRINISLPTVLVFLWRIILLLPKLLSFAAICSPKIPNAFYILLFDRKLNFTALMTLHTLYE